VLATRMWIYCQSSGRSSDSKHINSWIAGALDSAWRAVDQYLTFNEGNLPLSTQQTFYDMWGPTEYWDESSDEELVKLNRKLAERHLVIALHKAGVRIPGK